MDWRIATSLLKLREQINAAYPGRDKTSDGAIGDAAHASRKSDHNPWIWDGRTHVVSAIDIDEDVDSRGTIQPIVDAICASRDKRVKYIIYEGRITVAGSHLQRWKPYSGPNAHRHHVHISVFAERNLYDDRSPWAIGVGGQAVKEKEKPAVEQPAEIQPSTKPVRTAGFAAIDPADPQAQPPAPTPVVEVGQVNAEPEEDKEVPGIQASTAGAATFITTALGGVVTFLADKGWQIVLGLAIFGGLFVVTRFWYANREKDRQSKERQARELRAHEIQMATIKSAMFPTLNTVRVVPQPMLNSEVV